MVKTIPMEEIDLKDLDAPGLKRLGQPGIEHQCSKDFTLYIPGSLHEVIGDSTCHREIVIYQHISVQASVRGHPSDQDVFNPLIDGCC